MRGLAELRRRLEVGRPGPRLAGLAAGALAAALAAPAIPAGVLAAAAQPRVVVIVGPVGSLTAEYAAEAHAAAVAARALTPDVTEIVSPNATWPAVRSALQGATLVIYLGHGNGFPSPYRSSLAPVTEDGFGLNPVASGDNVAHQYFGEAYIAGSVHLAPGATVILARLC